MSRVVEVVNEERKLLLQQDSVEECIHFMDQLEGFIIPKGDLGIAFVTPDHCSQLHKDFFDDPEITDVMTFPGDPEEVHAGDIAICPKVASVACQQSGLSFQEELSLYLIHAYLHLAGLNDKTAEEQKTMREAEAFFLNSLQERNKLLAASWVA